VEIVGEGKTEDIVVQTAGSNVITFTATMGRVTNLTLRQLGDGNWDAVHIASGRLDLEDCDISSQGRVCVAIHDGADPRLRRNRIHNSNGSGVYAYQNSAGLLEDNEIFANSWAGVSISTGANPTLRRNRIRDGEQGGVRVYRSGIGLIEDNEIFGSRLSGIEITTGANPIVRRNRIRDARQTGVFVFENGAGLIEDNDILANKYSGIEVKEGGNPTARGNRIKGNREGVRVHKTGSGIFDQNVFADNKMGNWKIAADCEPNVTRTGNIES
jgi:F-box protein 11